MSSASDIIPSYSFDVSLDGVSFSFSKVTNISGSVEIDTIVEGGSNNAPIILRTPKRSPDMLLLEKGLYTSVKDTIFSLFKEGTQITSISISVLRNGDTVRMFFINKGVVVARQFSALDALNSSVLTISLQIAHTGMTELALPFGL